MDKSSRTLTADAVEEKGWMEHLYLYLKYEDIGMKGSEWRSLDQG